MERNIIVETMDKQMKLETTKMKRVYDSSGWVPEKYISGKHLEMNVLNCCPNVIFLVRVTNDETPLLTRTIQENIHMNSCHRCVSVSN